MLKKAYLEIMAAVKEFKDKASFFSLQLDGWTALTGEYIFQAVSSVDGTPFFETQPTPQGSKCDAGWMLKCVKPLVEDPKCAGLTADNCNGMQDLKAAFSGAGGEAEARRLLRQLPVARRGLHWRCAHRSGWRGHRCARAGGDHRPGRCAVDDGRQQRLGTSQQETC